jgi:hypothetical protein
MGTSMVLVLVPSYMEVHAHTVKLSFTPTCGTDCFRMTACAKVKKARPSGKWWRMGGPRLSRRLAIHSLARLDGWLG